MSEPVKIAIVIRSGIVVEVITAGVPVEFATVDYDTGGDPAGAVMVPQGTGIAPERAFVEIGTARADGPFVLDCFALAAGQPVFLVRLKAAGIQVTATGSEQAESYALEDARQFMREHAYTVEEVEQTVDIEADLDAEDVQVTVECEAEGPARGEGLWTYSVCLEMDIAAASEAEAPAAMRAMLGIPPAGGK